MAWQNGLVDVTSPALGHIRFLKHLMDFMRGSHVASVSVGTSGGTGYTVGDVVTIDGGTPYGDSNHVAQVEVLAAPGGVVTEVRVVQSGSYAVEPATIADNNPSGGTGSDLDLDVVMDSWMTAVPAAGGGGYTLGDTLTVTGGTRSVPATFLVTGEAGGVVTSVRLLAVGDYSELPANPAATTGGTGAGCTLTLTRRHWMIRTENYTDDETHWELIAEGVNGAGANPFVGYRTGTPPSGPQLMMMGCTSYNSGLTWSEQAGHSPIDIFTSSVSGTSARVPLTTSDIDFFFFVTGRRIIFIANVGNTYEFSYCGLYTPFQDDPASKYPLPFVIAGTTSRQTETLASGEGGLHCILMRHQGQNAHYVRDVGGVWRSPGTPLTISSPWKLWPYAKQDDINNRAEAAAPNIASGSGTTLPGGGSGEFNDNFYQLQATSLIGYASFGVGSRTYLCEPYTFIQDEVGAVQLLGELEGVFAIPGRGLIAEDLVEDQHGRQHQVFPNLSSTAFSNFYTVVRD